MNRLSIVLLLSLMTTPLLAAPVTSSRLRARLIVIDRSVSMEGDHLEDVRSDLLEYLQADPPGRTTPVGFIVFADSASDAKWCLNQKSATSFVEAITTGGTSTSVATGLASAIKEIRKWAGKADVELYLYTDDEDNTPYETRKRVDELSKLFSHRKQQQLAQTVVVRTWSKSGAGATIETILQANPDVTVEHTNEPVFINARLSPPPKQHTYDVQLSAAPSGKVGWEDNASNVVVYEIDWSLSATTPDNPAQAGTFAFQLDGASNAILTNSGTVTVATAPGKTQGTCEIRIQLSDDEVMSGKIGRKLTLNGSLVSQDSSVVLNQASLTAEIASLPVPPPQPTKISIDALNVEPGIWYEAPNIAFYRVKAHVSVDGRMPGGSKLDLEAPAGIARIKVIPNTIVAGEQDIEILLAAVVKPLPEETTFTFTINAPEDTPLVLFDEIEPLALSLTGPASLVIRTGPSATPGLLTTNRFVANKEVTLPLLLRLEGPMTRRFAEGCRFRLTGDAVAAGAVNLSPYQPHPVRLTGNSTCTPSYLLDSVDTHRLQLASLTTGNAVKDYSFQAEVRTYAPFKIHLCIGLSLLAFTGGSFSIYRFFSFLRSSGGPDQE